MKHKKLLIILIVISCMLLSACGGIPKLSAEETEMVSEYAAALLLKYDSANHSRLVDTAPFLDRYYAAVKNYEDQKNAYYEAIENEAAIRRREAEAQARASEAYNNDGTGGAEVINSDESGRKANSSNIPIGEFLSLGDFTVDYSGYELMDSYPKDPAEFGVSLSATSNNKLLVLYFDIRNISTSSKTLDLLHSDITYRVSVNGGR